MPADATVRNLRAHDWDAVLRIHIHAEGIATGNAAYETEVPLQGPRHGMAARSPLNAGCDGKVAGWAATLASYAGVAETSVYVADGHRGHGIGIGIGNALMYHQVTATDACDPGPSRPGLPGEPRQHRPAPLRRLPHHRIA